MYCIVFCIKIHTLNTIHTNTKEVKMAITTQDIHKAAQELQAEGIRPTQTNVRERLGGGSFTTIAAALKEWRAEQDTTTQLAQVVLPSDIAERTQVLTASIWEAAQDLANERLAKEREALEHKESLINAELDESNKIIETLESEQAELTEQLDKINNDLSFEREQKDQLTEQNKSLTQTEQHLQTRLQSEKERADKLQSKLDEQNAKIEQLAAQLAKETTTAEAAQQQAHEHAQRADQATADKTALSIENARLTGKADTLTEQLNKAETTQATQAERLEKLTAKVAQLEQLERENKELKRMIENAKAEQEKAKPRAKTQPDMLQQTDDK